MKPNVPLILSILLGACGDSSDGSGPSGPGGGAPGGSATFSLTSLVTGDPVSEATAADAELDYLFQYDQRSVLVKLTDGDDRLTLTIRDTSAWGEHLAPGDYEVYGLRATSEGPQGSTDVGGFFDGREYYVNQGEGMLTIELHENQRLRGRVQANLQPTGSSSPSHELRASFDARYALPAVSGLSDGQGEIRFSDSLVLAGTARVEDDGESLRIVVEEEASGSFLAGRIRKVDGQVPVGVYGGPNGTVNGEYVRDEMRSTSYNGDSGGSVDIISTDGGVLVGRLNFSGRARSSSGSGFSVFGVAADFRAPAP